MENNFVNVEQENLIDEFLLLNKQFNNGEDIDYGKLMELCEKIKNGNFNMLLNDLADRTIDKINQSNPFYTTFQDLLFSSESI